jgi:gamma-glutamyltranspeptidase/glutathione hydrolase
MIVAPEGAAAAVGLSVLRAGGNAVDAAVATSFALAVTYPRAGNLGGGGFLLYRAPGGSHEALDFRETAPRALTPAMFRNASGESDQKKIFGGGLVGRGSGDGRGARRHARALGHAPVGRARRPAIALAEEGTVVSPRMAETLEEERARLAADADARAIFFRSDAPLRAGDRLVQKDLAASLRAIAAKGAGAFYEGPIAEAIAKKVASTGGVMTGEDLTGYRTAPRTPITGTYRGRTIVSFPPPSSGGIVLLQALAMLERFDLSASGAGSALTLHRIAEAERRAFADRSAYLGDPDVVKVPDKALLDAKYVASRSATIRDDRATPSSKIRPGKLKTVEGSHTLHLSVADARGCAVSLTATLNSWYGSAMVVPGHGDPAQQRDGRFLAGAGRRESVRASRRRRERGRRREAAAVIHVPHDRREHAARSATALGLRLSRRTDDHLERAPNHSSRHRRRDDAARVGRCSTNPPSVDARRASARKPGVPG